MSKAQNIHDTKRWKRRRKNKYGDKCNKSKCGICAAHKRAGNSGKFDKKEHVIEKDIIKFEKNENDINTK
jgi:hypothetical protein